MINIKKSAKIKKKANICSKGKITPSSLFMRLIPLILLAFFYKAESFEQTTYTPQERDSQLLQLNQEMIKYTPAVTTWFAKVFLVTKPIEYKLSQKYLIQFVWNEVADRSNAVARNMTDAQLVNLILPPSSELNPTHEDPLTALEVTARFWGNVYALTKDQKENKMNNALTKKIDDFEKRYLVYTNLFRRFELSRLEIQGLSDSRKSPDDPIVLTPEIREHAIQTFDVALRNTGFRENYNLDVIKFPITVAQDLVNRYFNNTLNPSEEIFLASSQQNKNSQGPNPNPRGRQQRGRYWEQSSSNKSDEPDNSSPNNKIQASVDSKK